MTSLVERIEFAPESIKQLFLFGPTRDGNLVSKSARDCLFDLGLIEREHGWQWLTRAGIDYAIMTMELDKEKDRLRVVVARRQ